MRSTFAAGTLLGVFYAAVDPCPHTTPAYPTPPASPHAPPPPLPRLQPGARCLGDGSASAACWSFAWTIATFRRWLGVQSGLGPRLSRCSQARLPGALVAHVHPPPVCPALCAALPHIDRQSAPPTHPPSTRTRPLREQGNALDMLTDVNTGIGWVLRNAAAFGGDGKSFHLVGQSAGGQLGALALLAQVRGPCRGLRGRLQGLRRRG